MKKRINGTIIGVFAVGVLAAVATAQLDNLRIDDPDPETPAQPQQQKLIRVSTLNSIQANQEFQQNVQILQTQRQRAVELSAAIEAARTEGEKSALQIELDAIMAKLNENNQKMVKTYGFSLTRNYNLIVEKSHIYMFVTDEEADKFEAAQKKKEEEGQE